MVFTMRPNLAVTFYVGLALSYNPTISSTEAFHPNAVSPQKRLSHELRSTFTASMVEVTTSPIQGMRPGTSGLRKKVEIWQGSDEPNKYYLHNFIQSLIETAAAANNDTMLDTYVFTQFVHVYIIFHEIRAAGQYTNVAHLLLV